MKIKTNLRKLAKDYEESQKAVPHLIKASGKKAELFYRAININKPNFYARMKENNWESKHLEMFYYVLAEEQPPEPLLRKLGFKRGREGDLFAEGGK